MMLLCSMLSDLDDALRDKVNSLPPDRSFFSKAFSTKLAAEMSARRGALAGLPGAIVPDVPLGILRELRAKLPAVIEAHTAAVREAVASKVQSTISLCIDPKAHPKFVRQMLDVSAVLIKAHAIAATQQCHLLLQYEDDEVHTSNHYYMDIVQELRREILQDAESEEVWKKRPFLTGVDFTSLKKQSNREQELVDLQIKTYAYWKTMKKRLIGTPPL